MGLDIQTDISDEEIQKSYRLGFIFHEACKGYGARSIIMAHAAALARLYQRENIKDEMDMEVFASCVAAAIEGFIDELPPTVQ